MSLASKVFRTIALCSCMLGSLHANEQALTHNPLLGLPATKIADAYGMQKNYDIKRNGKTIGTHVLSFVQEDDSLTVNVDSSLAVRLLGIPVYRLAYVAEELWQENSLVSANATTTENGRSNTVSFSNSNAPNNTRFASNHWHPGVLRGHTVFNTLSGESSRISVVHLGLESVQTPDGAIDAHHYQYEDDIHANVWYDTDGLWLKMKFEGEDGSVIEYVRRR